VSKEHPRLERERKTIEAMIRLHCRGVHGSKGKLCRECSELAEYARARIGKCPFQEEKTTCAKCPVHCFKPTMREKVRAVMRYAGPRMLYRHPVLAILHYVDGFRKAPPDSDT
jgi:predicted amidophosphoribosyltransferase